MDHSKLLIAVIVMSGQLLTYFLGSFVYAQNLPEFIDNNETNKLFSVTGEEDSIVDVLLMPLSPSTRKGLVVHYCDAMLRTRKKIDPEAKDTKRFGFDIDTFKYDPRQSLFMYSLCVNVDEASKGKTILGEKYTYRNYKKIFKEVKYDESTQPVPINLDDFWKDDMEQNDVWGIPKQASLDSDASYAGCDPSWTMQACDFSGLLPVILKNILNEYTNIKLASIYGYKTEFDSDPELLKQAVDDFSAQYFNDPVSEDAPCNYRDMPYLNDTTTEDQSKHCSHPETRKELERVIRSAQSLIDKLKFLDHEEIMDPFEDTEKSKGVADYCSDTVSGTTPKHMLHACGFSNWGDVAYDADRSVFNNLMANELMWYNLFVDFYSNRIITDTSYGQQRFGSIDFTYRRNLKEVRNLGYEQAISKQAVFQTTRMLSNLYTTFPAYIALRAYQEDILNYRETLVKTYTPLHQLYYTFRNVQQCNEEGN